MTPEERIDFARKFPAVGCNPGRSYFPQDDDDSEVDEYLDAEEAAEETEL